MRDQIARLAEAQKAYKADPLTRTYRTMHTAFINAADFTDFAAILAQFDRLSKIEAAATKLRDAVRGYEEYDVYYSEMCEARRAFDAALAPSTGKSEKPDG